MKVNNLLCYEEPLAAAPLNDDWPMSDENEAASLCYTSGTTGNPKGVLYSHRSTVQHTFCTCASDCLALSARDIVLVVVPLFHANTWGIPYAQIPGTLDTCHRWTRDSMTFPNGTQVVEIDLDPETGRVTLERLTAVDDYGVVVNPLVAAGRALLEHAVYDPSSGQPISGGFMDYAMQRTGDLPSFELDFAGTRCTTNPGGVKGRGEASAIAAPNGPSTPCQIWRALSVA